MEMEMEWYELQRKLHTFLTPPIGHASMCLCELCKIEIQKHHKAGIVSKEEAQQRGWGPYCSGRWSHDKPGTYCFDPIPFVKGKTSVEALRILVGNLPRIQDQMFGDLQYGDS